MFIDFCMRRNAFACLPERPDDKETSSTTISETVPTPIDFSASDDGDQYVALEWATMAMPDAQIEFRLKP